MPTDGWRTTSNSDSSACRQASTGGGRRPLSKRRRIAAENAPKSISGGRDHVASDVESRQKTNTWRTEVNQQSTTTWLFGRRRRANRQTAAQQTADQRSRLSTDDETGTNKLSNSTCIDLNSTPQPRVKTTAGTKSKTLSITLHVASRQPLSTQTSSPASRQRTKRASAAGRLLL